MCLFLQLSLLNEWPNEEKCTANVSLQGIANKLHSCSTLSVNIPANVMWVWLDAGAVLLSAHGM